MKQPEEQLRIVSAQLENAQHRVGIAQKLVMTSFYPNAGHEYAAMDAVMLLFGDIDAALRAARFALNGTPGDGVPF